MSVLMEGSMLAHAVPAWLVLILASASCARVVSSQLGDGSGGRTGTMVLSPDAAADGRSLQHGL